MDANTSITCALDRTEPGDYVLTTFEVSAFETQKKAEVAHPQKLGGGIPLWKPSIGSLASHGYLVEDMGYLPSIQLQGIDLFEDYHQPSPSCPTLKCILSNQHHLETSVRDYLGSAYPVVSSASSRKSEAPLCQISTCTVY